MYDDIYDENGDENIGAWVGSWVWKIMIWYDQIPSVL